MDKQNVDYIKLNPPVYEILFQRIQKIVKYTFPLIIFLAFTLFTIGVCYESKLCSSFIMIIILIIIGIILIIILVNCICLYKTYNELSKEVNKELNTNVVI